MVPSPDKAPQLAEAFVKTARDAYGRALDYSLDSLPQVDRILDDLGRADRGGADNRLLLVAASCYLGEVIIRAGAGAWVAAGPREPLSLKAGALRAVPHDKVLKRLEEGPEEALLPYAMLFLEKAQPELEMIAAREAARQRGLFARLKRWVNA
ncbi:hypothetical protein [Mameliella sediminis]|uniref:hypothetical protein n=1 Tax=Mameliella sediminis TaxID=2836866 RepID=UPI001C487C7D|nr:hypothetical protein [Mameliella sediminis]MBV7393858.1 hypothetical protein [Mameliella sediminis]MBY6162229.1 hypothetical protein [Mameliella alba]MBY6170698.1 hypothetical protein [Mameliella alba]MBY6175716.1 hypothetical protein [Mameliella alba]